MQISPRSSMAHRVWSCISIRNLLGMACLTVMLLCQTIHAAPRPPRGGSANPGSVPQPTPQDQVSETQAPAEVHVAKIFHPTPLSVIAEQHKTNNGLTTAHLHEVNMREMSDVLKRDYLAHGKRNEKWDAPLLAAIDETLWCLEIGASISQREKLVQLLRKPARLKCDDPRYYYMYAYSRGYQTVEDMKNALETGVKLAAEDPEHNRHLLWLLSLRHSQYLTKYRKTEEALAARQTARQHFVLWLEQDAPAYGQLFTYEWMEYLAEMLKPVAENDSETASIQQTLDDIDKLQNLESWVKLLVQARGARVAAWAARGGGYANTVTDKGWAVWREKNIQAYDQALKAHQLNPNQALAATLLIELCWSTDEHQGELYSSRYWFEQAVKAVVDYDDAYTAYAWGIMPRWGGSIPQEFAFAQECAMTSRPDTLIAHHAFGVIFNILRDQDQTKLINPQLAQPLYSIVELIFKNYLAHEKDPRKRKQLQQYWLHWTYNLNLPDQGAIVHGLLDEPYDTTLAYDAAYPLHGMTTYKLAVFLAQSKPHGDTLADAMFTETYDKDKAAALYAEVLKHDNLDPVIAHHATGRLQALAWQKSYESGQWVDLNIGPNLEGFQPLTGQWERIDDKTIQGTSDKLPMRITPWIDMGHAYEVQMTIHFINKPKGPPLMAGLVYATARQPSLGLQYGVFIRQDPGSIWAHLGGFEPYRFSLLPVEPKVTCHFVYQKNRMSLSIDGQEVFAPYYLTRDPEHYTLSIGSAYLNAPGAVVQFSDMRVRRLPEP